MHADQFSNCVACRDIDNTAATVAVAAAASSSSKY